MWIIRYYRHLWKQREKLKGVLRCDSEFDWLFNNIHKAYHFHSMPNISCLVLSFTLRLILTIIHIWTGGSKTNFVKIISTQHSLVLWLLNPASCTQTLVYCSPISTYVLFEQIKKSFRKNQDKATPPSPSQPVVRWRWWWFNPFLLQYALYIALQCICKAILIYRVDHVAYWCCELHSHSLSFWYQWDSLNV